MGRGKSGAGGGAKGGGGAPLPTANTPSGITYDQFMQMSESEKMQTMGDIVMNNNIQVPSYLDDSDTTKVIYALGMNNKPTVVSDTQLDAMRGTEIYRTVYETGSMPPPSSDAILDQVRNGDYTHMSGSGGSAHGRAIYFATNFRDSRVYGDSERNAMMGRAKISTSAKIVSESKIKTQMQSKGFRVNGAGLRDQIALYALSQGIDGWYSGTYTMVVNRGVLTMSSQNKKITKAGSRVKSENITSRSAANSWAEAGNA